ncbi:hypothetical protein BH23ACT1_BH23ACT1_05770 [soil metagenome]
MRLLLDTHCWLWPQTEGDEPPAVYRIHGDRAVWWPLISPPEEHVDEASFVALILASASISWPLTLGLFGCEDWLSADCL